MAEGQKEQSSSRAEDEDGIDRLPGGRGEADWCLHVKGLA